MSAAARRITKEYAELQADFPPHVVAQPDESNLLHWVSLSAPSPSSDIASADQIVGMA